MNTTHKTTTQKIKSAFIAILLALGVITAGGVAFAPAANAATTTCGTKWMYQTAVGGYKHADRKIVQRYEAQNCHVTYNLFERTVLGKKNYYYNKDTGWMDYKTYKISTGKLVAFSKTNIAYSVYWQPKTKKYAGDKFWDNLPIANY